MPYRARDIMTTDISSVEPEMSLVDLESKFLSEKIGGAPVVSEGKLVGVVSRSDIVRILSVEESYAETTCDFYQIAYLDELPDEAIARSIGRQVGQRLEQLNVSDAMVGRVITAPPEEPIAELAKTMLRYKIHRILITDGDTLVGLVSATDLIRLIAQEQLIDR